MRNPFRRQYYYVVTRVNGQTVVWMKEEWKSEEEANQAAFKAIKGRLFQVITKPYKDVGRVTQEAKSMRLEDSADIEGSIRRAVHDPNRLKLDDNEDGDDGLSPMGARR